MSPQYEAQRNKPRPEVGAQRLEAGKSSKLLVVIKIQIFAIFTREADPSGQVFQRGYVLYGIYLPSLSGRLQVCHHPPPPAHYHHHHCIGRIQSLRMHTRSMHTDSVRRLSYLSTSQISYSRSSSS